MLIFLHINNMLCCVVDAYMKISVCELELHASLQDDGFYWSKLPIGAFFGKQFSWARFRGIIPLNSA